MDPEVYHYHYGQDPLKRQLSVTQKGLWQIGKLCCNAFVYSPLLFTGYYIMLQFLDRKVPALWWIGGVAGCAMLLYQMLFLLKGMLIGLKQKGSNLWLLLLMVCIAFTCILPAYMAMEPAAYLATKMKSDASIGRIIVIILGVYIYTRYNFHEDLAPTMAATAYKTGMQLVL